MFMITRKKRAKKNYSDTLFVLAEMTQDSVVIGEIYALILYGIFSFACFGLRLRWLHTKSLPKYPTHLTEFDRFYRKFL